MAKLVEGNRVFTAVTNTAALASEINDLQDQLATSNKSLSTSVLRMGQGETANAMTWDAVNLYWDLSSAATGSWQIPVRAGQKITAIYLTLSHSAAAATGGQAELVWRETLQAAPGARNAEDTPEVLDGDPWNTGGAGEFYTLSITGLSITAAANTDYFVRILGLGTQSTYVSGVDFTAQFGN